MESENKILMTVETGNSVKTIADLKKEISDLKKALDQEKVGSEEAKKASEDLANAQNQLQQAVKGSTDVINIADGSYKSLEQQCNKLKLAYKSMADGIEKRKIGKKIAEIQENLKKQDAAIGDFKRNVGDYANAFGAALTSMGAKGGAAFTNLANAGKGFKVVLDLLKAHPIILTISVVTLALMGLVNLIKKNEDAVRKLMISLEPFKKLFDVILKAAQKLAGYVADYLTKAFDDLSVLVEKIVTLLGREDIAQKMKQARDLAKEQAYYAEKIADAEKKRSKYILDMIEAQIDYNKVKGDEKKELEAAEQIEKNRIKTILEALDLARAEYELKKLTAKESDEAAKDAEEAANKVLALEQQLTQISNEWLTTLKNVGKQQQLNANNSMIADIRANILRNEEAIKQYQYTLDEIQKRADSLKLRLQNMYLLPQERQWLENELENEKTRIESQEKLIDYTKQRINDLNRLLKQYQQQVSVIDGSSKQITEQTTDELIKAIEERSKVLDKYVLSYFNFGTKKLKDLTRKELESVLKGLDDVIKKHEFDGLISDMVKKGYKEPFKVPIRIDIEETDDKESRKFIERANELRNAVESVYTKYKDAQLDFKQQYNKNLHYLELAEQTHLITHKEFLKAKANLDKEYTDSLKKESKKQADIYFDVANNIAAILGSIADTMDENNEEAFEAAKAFNIASATISTITGALQAYMSAQDLPFPANVIVGAVQAAAVTAAGVAQIAQISRQQYNSSGSGNLSASNFGSASSSAVSAVNAPLQMTTAVEGAAINESIADTKVYVVESDIQTVGRKVDVQEQENHY